MQCDIEQALWAMGAKDVTFKSPRYFFTASGGSHPWQLELEWDDLTVLPSLFLAIDHCTQHRPHVSWDRKVCYSDGEGISFDHEQLNAVLAEALAKAITVLDAGDNGDLRSFWEESEGYFNLIGKNENRGNAKCYFSLNETPRKLKSFLHPDCPQTINFFDNKEQCWSLDSSAILKALAKKKMKHKGQRNKSILRSPTAFYLPLDKPPIPPLPGQAWDVEDILALVEPLVGKVLGLDKQLKKNQQYYVFSSPRSDNSKGAFAVSISLKEGDNVQVRYYTVRRQTRDYLLARGGIPEAQHQALQKITIIGCGAVGGYLANLMAQSGYQDLTLVDYDIYQADNCYRHILPKQYVGAQKVIALKKYLEDSYIDLNITPVADSAIDWATPKNIEKLSVIISATGNPTLDRCLTQLFHQHAIPGQILLSTWLEPVSLGGHVVLTLAGSQGCLNCLYTQENEFTGVPIVSFIKSGQKVTRNLTGCGGAFTPFSGLDAQQTALLAVRTLEAHLCGQRESIYDCWIGSRKFADLAKITTSAVYDSHFAEQQDWWQQKVQHGCSVCRGK